MAKQRVPAWEQAIFDRVALGLVQNNSEPYDESAFERQMLQNQEDDAAGKGVFDLLEAAYKTAGKRE